MGGPTQEQIQAEKNGEQLLGYIGAAPAPTLSFTSSNAGSAYTALDYIGTGEETELIIKPVSHSKGVTGIINRAWLQMDKVNTGGDPPQIRVHLYQSIEPILNGIDDAVGNILAANGVYKVGYIDFTSFTAMNPSSAAPLEFNPLLLNPLFFKRLGMNTKLYTVWQSLSATTPDADTTYTLMLGNF